MYEGHFKLVFVILCFSKPSSEVTYLNTGGFRYPNKYFQFDTDKKDIQMRMKYYLWNGQNELPFYIVLLYSYMQYSPKVK